MLPDSKNEKANTNFELVLTYLRGVRRIVEYACAPIYQKHLPGSSQKRQRRVQQINKHPMNIPLPSIAETAVSITSPAIGGLHLSAQPHCPRRLCAVQTLEILSLQKCCRQNDDDDGWATRAERAIRSLPIGTYIIDCFNTISCDTSSLTTACHNVIPPRTTEEHRSGRIQEGANT